MNIEKFPSRIKILRETKDLTLKAFGETLGVSTSVVANLEYGRVKPSEMVINLISLKHGVSRKWLTGDSDDMFGSEEKEIQAALDDLMSGSEHENTRALITALVKMSPEQLNAIDAYIDRLLEVLGR
mgnify:CR=1 FL=1